MSADLTARFAAVMAAAPGGVDLGEAALLIAAHGRPGLDVESYLGRLDDLALSCDPPTLDGLRALLFDELGFSGDESTYDDPSNSFLDAVIERRTGLPITLSVLMIEVGRRIGVPLEGIGLPGHFLVRHAAVPVVMVDPFHRGRLLDRQACEQLVERITGRPPPLPDAAFRPVAPTMVIARMLANLRQSFLVRSDQRSLEWVLRLRATMADVAPAELAQLARVRVGLGRFEEAAAALDQLADDHGGDSPAAEAARSQARRLRAQLN